MQPAGQPAESAEVLKDLARPLIADCPDVGLQKSLVSSLEQKIGNAPGFTDKKVLFVGAFELPLSWDTSQESALFQKVQLVNLPSRWEADQANSTGPAHSLASNLNGFSLVDGTALAPDLARHAVLTMRDARQLEYLRKSRIPGQEWKILVEIHYYRDRTGVGRDKLHKDTYGETLFVNLNYDMDQEIPGPEYILNPPLVSEHEEQIAQSLPERFLEDLKWIRGQLGEPAEISAPRIPANGFVAFVDEAIHHMSPHYGGRTVTGAELAGFLAKVYGVGTVQDARTAYHAFTAQTSSWAGWLWSFITAPNPFSSYLKVIPAADADMWFALIEMAGTPARAFDRLDLLNGDMSSGLIDQLFAETWEGYQQVAIPRAQTVSAVRAPLKRQMSKDTLTGNLPPEPSGSRRFFRTWVRAVRTSSAVTAENRS